MSGNSQTGYSLIELLVVLAITGILASIAMTNFQVFTERSYDSAAEADYRNLKTGLTSALTDPNSPNRFVFRNRRGPGVFPYPLSGTGLSDSVEATVFHQTRLRRNGRPQTQTRLDVYHLRGGKHFRYREVDGVITEQVLER